MLDFVQSDSRLDNYQTSNSYCTTGELFLATIGLSLVAKIQNQNRLSFVRWVAFWLVVGSRIKEMKHPLLLCLVMPLVLAFMLALVLSAILGKHYGVSFVVGSFIFVIANTYFVFYAFRVRLNNKDPVNLSHHSESSYQALLAARSFKRGEFGKLVISAMGFALVFLFMENIVTSLLFAGFVTMVVLQVFLASAVAKNQQ